MSIAPTLTPMAQIALYRRQKFAGFWPLRCSFEPLRWFRWLVIPSALSDSNEFPGPEKLSIEGPGDGEVEHTISNSPLSSVHGVSGCAVEAVGPEN